MSIWSSALSSISHAFILHKSSESSTADQKTGADSVIPLSWDRQTLSLSLVLLHALTCIPMYKHQSVCMVLITLNYLLFCFPSSPFPYIALYHTRDHICCTGKVPPYGSLSRAHPILILQLWESAIFFLSSLPCFELLNKLYEVILQDGAIYRKWNLHGMHAPFTETGVMSHTTQWVSRAQSPKYNETT